MISPELMRRFPLFSELSTKQIQVLAVAGNQVHVEPGTCFFNEGDAIRKFYVVVEGEVNIFLKVTDQSIKHTYIQQLLRNVVQEDVTVSTSIAGDLFGWSGLIPPHIATAGARAKTSCIVMEFNLDKLQTYFERDCKFAYLMTLKAAQTMNERINNLQIESLAFLPVPV